MLAIDLKDVLPIHMMRSDDDDMDMGIDEEDEELAEYEEDVVGGVEEDPIDDEAVPGVPLVDDDLADPLADIAVADDIEEEDDIEEPDEE